MSQSNIYLGTTNIEEMKFGNKAVEFVYLGDVQVFAQGEFVGVKMSPSSVDFYLTETIKTIRVKSSEEWTLSTDANWLTFSQTSGDSGVSVVTVTSTSGDSALTAVICATTANYSASTTVTYTPIDTNIYDWCKLNATTANTGYRITDIDDEIEYVFAFNNGGQGAWGVFLSDLLTGDAFDANVHLSKTIKATKMRVSDYGMNNSSIDISTDVVYTYIGNKNGATLNGTAITLNGTAELKNQGTITINGQSEGWGAVYLEFRRLVIRNSGVEKLHIVPYMNNGTACLKDLVSGNIINATIASIGNDD